MLKRASTADPAMKVVLLHGGPSATFKAQSCYSLVPSSVTPLIRRASQVYPKMTELLVRDRAHQNARLIDGAGQEGFAIALRLPATAGEAWHCRNAKDARDFQSTRVVPVASRAEHAASGTASPRRQPRACSV